MLYLCEHTSFVLFSPVATHHSYIRSLSSLIDDPSRALFFLFNLLDFIAPRPLYQWTRAHSSITNQRIDRQIWQQCHGRTFTRFALIFIWASTFWHTNTTATVIFVLLLRNQVPLFCRQALSSNRQTYIPIQFHLLLLNNFDTPNFNPPTDFGFVCLNIAKTIIKQKGSVFSHLSTSSFSPHQLE